MSVSTNFFELHYPESPLHKIPEKGITTTRPSSYIFFNGALYGAYRTPGSIEVPFQVEPFHRLAEHMLVERLRQSGFQVQGRIRKYVFKPSDIINNSHRDVFELVDGFNVQIMMFDKLLLRIEPKASLRVNVSFDGLIDRSVDVSDYVGGIVSIILQSERLDAVLLSIADGYATVLERGQQKTLHVALTDVFPISRADMIEQLLTKMGRSHSVVNLVRKTSFLSDQEPPRRRLEKTVAIARLLQREVFPMDVGNIRVDMAAEPVPVRILVE